MRRGAVFLLVLTACVGRSVATSDKPAAAVALELDARAVAGGYELELRARALTDTPELELVFLLPAEARLAAGARTQSFGPTLSGTTRTLHARVAMVGIADVIAGARLPTGSRTTHITLGNGQRAAPVAARTVVTPFGVVSETVP